MEGGGLALVLPPKAAWFDTEFVHDIEKAALPEFFDGSHGKTMHSHPYICICIHIYVYTLTCICMLCSLYVLYFLFLGKTMESYLWHREAILTQWHLHLAAHIARSFSARAAAGCKRSGDRAGRGGATLVAGVGAALVVGAKRAACSSPVGLCQQPAFPQAASSTCLLPQLQCWPSCTSAGPRTALHMALAAAASTTHGPLAPGQAAHQSNSATGPRWARRRRRCSSSRGHRRCWAPGSTQSW